MNNYGVCGSPAWCWGLIQWNPDFSNPRFPEPPDISNQFLFPLGLLHSSSIISSPISQTLDFSKLPITWTCENSQTILCGCQVFKSDFLIVLWLPFLNKLKELAVLFSPTLFSLIGFVWHQTLVRRSCAAWIVRLKFGIFFQSMIVVSFFPIIFSRVTNFLLTGLARDGIY